MLYVLITLFTLIATALPSAADIFKYRDASGKLILSNQPPPAGSKVESQHEATPPSLSPTPVPHRGRSSPREPVRALPSYVDLHPIELQDSRVEDSTVSWKKSVTGVVKNRSGIATATEVMVRTSCTMGGRVAETGSVYIGTIGPRGSRAFQIPIVLDVPEQVYYRHGHRYTVVPNLPPVSCQTRVTYTAQ
jgi:hypothetical protein